MKKISSLFVFLLFSRSGFSQEVEMADGMRSEGKIYVVVAILLTILAGLVTYLFAIDRKVIRLEKKVEELSKKM